ncbi:MAG: GNAT family N-acetyltransferase [Desulfobacteraceae bacterium]|nr:GNAT family N-acetyltransferase [Desulfobacteraceae bacterium]
MKVIQSKLEHIDQLVEIVEEYRQFCGCKSNPEKTKIFFQNLINNNESITFIAIDEETNKLMGFVNLYPSYSTLSLKRLWILNDLGVSYKYRGFGVAKSLIGKVISFASETKAVRIELKTQKINNNAQKLYTR